MVFIVFLLNGFILNMRLHVDAYYLRVDDLYSIVYIDGVNLKMLPAHVLLDLFR